ncbi:MAG: LysR family transcriptional regulator [Sandaracinaceae bacterium]
MMGTASVDARRPSSMDNLNYNHLYYFHVVAEEGSLAGAAHRLSVTKPTISAQIRQLEDYLGRQLFDRRGGRLRLNEDGRQAFARTRVMFDAGRDLARLFRDEEPDPTTLLRIGIESSVARSVAGTFLDPLLALEEVRLRLMSGAQDDMQERLLSFDIDVLLLGSRPPNPDSLGLTYTLVRRTPVILLGNTGLTSGSPEEILRRLPLMSYLPATGIQWHVDAYLQRLEVRPAELCAADDVGTLLTLAARRPESALFAPEDVAQRSIEAGELRVLARPPDLFAETYAVHVQRDVPRIVQAAVEGLQRAYAPRNSFA